MKYIIQDYNTSELQVYYTQWTHDSDDKINMTAMVMSEGNVKDPIAVLFFTSTNFGYLTHVHKMECDLRTATAINVFFNDQTNWLP